MGGGVVGVIVVGVVVVVTAPVFIPIPRRCRKNGACCCESDGGNAAPKADITCMEKSARPLVAIQTRERGMIK